MLDQDFDDAVPALLERSVSVLRNGDTPELLFLASLQIRQLNFVEIDFIVRLRESLELEEILLVVFCQIHVFINASERLFDFIRDNSCLLFFLRLVTSD